MKTFKVGNRVIWSETRKVGTVRHQFLDGYVSIIFDDGGPAQLPASSLARYKPAGKKIGPTSRRAGRYP